MWKRYARTVCGIVLSAALTGCSSFRQNLGILINGGAAPTMVQSEAASKVDLIREIVPPNFNWGSVPQEYKACKPSNGNSGSSKWTTTTARMCAAYAYRLFYSDKLDQVQRRNAIQADLRKASELQCATYERLLNSFQSGNNFALGSLATILGGAGAIVTSETAARALAGSAGITSGIKAEFNADVFFEKAVPVLVKAIESSRAKQRAAMAANAGKSMADYPLQDAIADAIRYNNSCSLVVALGELDQDVTLANNPGLDAVITTLAKANLARKVVTDKLTSVPAESLQTTPQGVQRVLGTLSPSSVSGVASQNPDDATASALVDIASTVRHAQAQIQELVGSESAFETKAKLAENALNKYAKALRRKLTYHRAHEIASATNKVNDAKANLVNTDPKESSAYLKAFYTLQRAELQAAQMSTVIAQYAQTFAKQVNLKLGDLSSKVSAWKNARTNEKAKKDVNNALDAIAKKFKVKTAKNPPDIDFTLAGIH